MTDQSFEGNISGGPASGNLVPAPLRKRFIADVMDLVVIPALLGVVFGFILLNAGDLTRDIVLGIVYVGWIFVRDLFFSPGRWMVGLKLVSTADSGGQASIKQIFLRNVLLLPYILILGYLVEFGFLIWKHERLMDSVAKTRVIAST